MLSLRSRLTPRSIARNCLLTLGLAAAVTLGPARCIAGEGAPSRLASSTPTQEVPALPGVEWAVVGKKAQGARPLHGLVARTATPLEVKVHRPDTGNPSVYFSLAEAPVAGINAQGISVTALLPKRSTSKAGRDLLLRILTEASSLDDTTTLLKEESDEALEKLESGAAFLVVDGKTSDARLYEIGPKGVSLFGPSDDADPHPIAGGMVRGNQLATVAVAAMPESKPLVESAQKFLNQKDKSLDLVTVADWLGEQLPDRGAVRLCLRPSELDALVVMQGSAELLDIRSLLRDSPATAEVKLPTLAEFRAEHRDGIDRSTVQPAPRTNDEALPETYRLDTKPFEAEIEPAGIAGGIRVDKVRFPSPIVTPYEVNNTIHGELFRPFGTGPYRCIIVLHIAGGDFELSRFQCRLLARSGFAALFVKLPYYGERRPENVRVRMLSGDLQIGIKSMQQAVVDLRRTCDWIASRPDLEHDQMGLLGVSLGGVAGALATANEPRITHACLIMAGGAIEHIMYESHEREAREFRGIWVKNGKNREEFAEVMAPIDPARYGDQLKDRIILMINARDDQTIPRASTVALWEATGRQRQVWYPCGHYSMAKYFVLAMRDAVAFFQEWPTQRELETAAAPKPDYNANPR